MTETVYYEDENAAITSQWVRLGEKSYALRDVRYVGVVPQLPQPITRSTRIWQLLIILLVFLAYVALVYLLSLFSIPSWVVYLFLIGPMVANLLSTYLNKRRPYPCLLSIRLPEGFETTFPSTDKKYLERIAKAINAAVVEDRKALKSKQPNSRMVRN
jgi:hypothetical protein